MKSFFQFLSEATQSQASLQAKKLNLKSDGHGGWYDSRGEFVAKTESGKLKFYNKGEKVGQKDQPKEPASKSQPTPASQVPQQQPVAPQRKSSNGSEEGDDSGETSDTLTVVFGRFNPPTIGHEKLLKSADKISAGGDLKIYPSRTQDPKKNPLDPDMKISFMKKMFPDYKDNIINDDDMKSIFNVLVAASEEGYQNVNIVVGSDRQAEFENLAQKYNGDLYDFDLIRVVSAGVRDADAEGVSGMSASKMRKSVMDDDFDSFRRGTPKTLDDGDTRALFDAVRQSMGAKKSKIKKEGYSLWEIAPKFDMKNLRENYVTKNIFNLGEVVENLNTGLVGRIMRRGANHLICVTNEGFMFKSWIKDVMEAEVSSKNLKTLVKKAVNRKDNNIDGFVDKEDSNVGPYGAFIPQARNVPKNFREAYQEKRVESKMRESGKPNTLVGTSGYLKNAMQMTGTTNIKNFINKYKAKK
jgi:uncharacterized protein YbgA (DUF1722 family)